MKFTRLNIDYCVYLILTCVLYFVDGGINHCGKNIGDIGRHTQVRITNDGFCSENGPSCCQSWTGLVDPGLDLLFGKASTYSKLNRLNDIIRNIRTKIGDLECHKNKDDSSSSSPSPSSSAQLFNDIVTSLDTLTDMNWIMLLNNTFHGSNCGRRLTELMFCSPDYCLYNQTEQLSSNSNSCHGQCQNMMETCISDTLGYLLGNWKRAIGSLSTTLRILSAKTTCQADKAVIETLEWQLKEFRDPVSWMIESCATYGFNPCTSKTTNNFRISKSQDMDKSIESHSSKLQSLISSLEKHWQGHEIMSILDQDDLASSSGSGWGLNEQFTDDEDLLNEHIYGSGSGESGINENNGGGQIIDNGLGNAIYGGSSTISPPDKGRTGGAGTNTGPPKGSSSSRISFSSTLLYSFNLVSLLLFFTSIHL